MTARSRSSSSASAPTALPNVAWQRLADVLKDFASAQQRGERPAIDDFLARADGPAERQALLVELVHADREFRLQAGEAVRLESYLERYPQLRGEGGADLAAAPLASTPSVAPARDTLQRAVPGTPTAAPGSLGRYELREEVGRGGMGVVYLARDLALDRDVAVKTLSEHHGADPAAIRRFLVEATITGQLQHPGIPPVHEVGTLPDGRPFLAMKLVKGQTLRTLLHARSDPGQQRGRFIAIFEQICQALGYAHAHRVIHRDLKPGNVMVGAHGEVQVMDWGLAKLLREHGDTTQALAEEEDLGRTTPHRTAIDSPEAAGLDTRTGQALGTFAYMPPEQAGGQVRLLDARSDVFGLGAILCEIVTGQPPYQARTENEVRLQAVRGELAGVLTRLEQSGAEPELTALCQRCLAFGQDDRPRDGAAVAAEVGRLRQAAEDRARQAELERERTLVRALEQGKRRRLVQWAGAVIAAVLLAGSSVATVFGIRANHNATRAERAAQAEAEQRQTAERQQRRAEESEAATLAALRASTDDAIEQLIGARPVLGVQEKAYLEKTLKRWQAFADRAGDDERSRAIRAEGHLRVAYLRSKLGQGEEAAAGFREALALYQKLAADYPAVPAYRQDLARSHNNLGLLLAGQNQADKAAQQYEKALAIQQKLAADYPAVPAYRLDLAGSHNNLANLLAGQKQADKAAQHYDQALALFQKLAADYPAVPEYRQALATSHLNLGALLAGQNQADKAAQHYDQALALFRKLAADYPAVPAYRQDLARSHRNLGILLAGQNQADRAAQHCEKALAIQQKLAADYPAVPGYCQELARSHNNLGLLLADQNQADKAAQHYDQALAIQQKLAADYPAVPVHRQDLARSHFNLGTLLAGQNQADKAAQHYERALALFQKLAADHPAVPAYQVDLGGSCDAFGNLLRASGKAAESLPWYDRAIRTLSAVHRQDPRSVKPRLFLRNSHWGRANAYDLLAKHAEAVKDWSRAIELSPPREQPLLRLRRAIARVRAGQVAESVTEAAELTKTGTWDAVQWYDIACIYGVAAARDAGKKQEYGDRAMELLQRAVKAGYKNAAHMARDTDLDVLRQRDDFKKLMQSLAKPNGKAPAGKPKPT